MGYATNIFSKRLKEIREATGLTQEQLAEELKITRAAISYYEKGKRTPNIEFIYNLTRYFNIPVDFALGYVENIKIEPKKGKEDMRVIYLSGPITGTDDYMKRFAEAEYKLTEKGYTVINPARVNGELPHGMTHTDYMYMSFAMIDLCEEIYMMKGWQKSKGAIQEWHYAEAMQKVIKEEK